jgi:ATP-binding cassette subfamily B protein/subfamily B ATP-binding cassette protein MsbA
MVVVMQDGRSVERGSHAELLDRDGLYARLVRSQALVEPGAVN